MTTSHDIEMGSDNVFRDLGLPQPELHQLKAELVSQLGTILREHGIALTTAAHQLGLSEHDLHDITRGHFRTVPVDDLLRYLLLLGARTTITVHPPTSATFARSTPQ